MANPILLGVLLWLHIFSVVSWFGAVLFFVVIIEATLPKLSPQTNGELVVKMFPRFIGFVEIFSVLTLLFGIALAFLISGGDIATFLKSSTGLYVTTGACFGFATLLILFLLAAPSLKKLGKVIVEMQTKQLQQPPPEFHVLERRLKLGGPAALSLLLLALVFMVAAAV